MTLVITLSVSSISKGSILSACFYCQVSLRFCKLRQQDTSNLVKVQTVLSRLQQVTIAYIWWLTSLCLTHFQVKVNACRPTFPAIISFPNADSLCQGYLTNRGFIEPCYHSITEPYFQVVRTLLFSTCKHHFPITDFTVIGSLTCCYPD